MKALNLYVLVYKFYRSLYKNPFYLIIQVKKNNFTKHKILLTKCIVHLRLTTFLHF